MAAIQLPATRTAMRDARPRRAERDHEGRGQGDHREERRHDAEEADRAELRLGHGPGKREEGESTGARATQAGEERERERRQRVLHGKGEVRNAPAMATRAPAARSVTRPQPQRWMTPIPMPVA